MSDALVDAARRARTWPAGSGARQTLTKVAVQLMAKRETEIAEMEELLARQWAWLEERGDPGADGATSNTERYEDGVRRFQLTLASMEDLCDGLEEARAVLSPMLATAA